MYRHNPQGLEFGTRYRIDSASGSSTPVTVYRTDATTNPIGTAFTGTSGSTVREHDPRGGDTVFYASQATLYLKPLDYLGVQLGGGAVITSTGVAPADPGNGQPNYSGTYAASVVLNEVTYGGTGVDATAHINAQIQAAATYGARAVVVPAKNFTCDSALTMVSGVSLVGSGWGASPTSSGPGNGSQITFRGTGTFINITSSLRDLHFRNIRFSHAGATGTLFYLDGCFRCSWVSCTFDGKHYSPEDTVPAANTAQTCFEMRNNAGDNRIIDCNINNFGAAIRTSTIMNYLIGSVIGSCWWGVYGDAGSFGAGMTIDNCVFTSTLSQAYSTRGILIDVNANQWWVTNTWFEGQDVPVQVGSTSTGGPVGFYMSGCKLAGTTKDLDVQYSKMTTLIALRLSTNPAMTPTPITIDATNAPEGFAAQIVDDQNFSIANSVFPAGWTYAGRGKLLLPSTVERNLALNGIQTITPQATGDIPLVLNGSSSTTVDIAQFKKGATVLFTFDRFGGLTTTGNITCGGGHLRATGTAFTLAAGANNGTSPPAPAVVSGYGGMDNKGVVQFGSGTTPAAGAQVVVTFATSYGGTVPVVTVSPYNAVTQALGLYVSSVSATTFTLSTVNAPSASQVASTYQFGFHAIG